MVADGSNGEGHGDKGWDGDASDDDVDRLIREIAHGRRTPSGREIVQLRNHVATARFSVQRVRAKPDIRGVTYHGRTVQTYDDAAFVHLVQRVVVDEQWAYGTTLVEYLDDLRRAAGDPQSWLAIYDKGPGPVATVFGANTIPDYRRGMEQEPYIVAVYASNRHGIISGYQASSLKAVRIPGDAIWLR